LAFLDRSYPKDSGRACRPCVRRIPIKLRSLEIIESKGKESGVKLIFVDASSLAACHFFVHRSETLGVFFRRSAVAARLVKTCKGFENVMVVWMG
jgi:hypothetical protein